MTCGSAHAHGERDNPQPHGAGPTREEAHGDLLRARSKEEMRSSLTIDLQHQLAGSATLRAANSEEESPPYFGAGGSLVSTRGRPPSPGWAPTPPGAPRPPATASDRR